MMTNSVELALNTFWLAASVCLGVVLVLSRNRCRTKREDPLHSHATACISYLILVAMLLPVISMNDDLQAMVVPKDGEQIVRRCEGFAPSHASVNLHVAPLIQTRNLSFAPLSHFTSLGTIPYFHLYRCSYRQTTRDRAPPIAV